VQSYTFFLIVIAGKNHSFFIISNGSNKTRKNIQYYLL